jgi:hypothetical protein
MYNHFFPSKIMPFMRKCEKKHCRAGQALDDSKTFAYYMLDKYG